MPRVSEAERAVVSIVPPTVPPPPDELTATQARIWGDIHRSLPQGWIHPSGWALAVQYCRHTALSDALARKLRRLPVGSAAAARVSAQLAAESRAMIQLARCLRLSPRAQLSARSAKTLASSQPKPWD